MPSFFFLIFISSKVLTYFNSLIDDQDESETPCGLSFKIVLVANVSLSFLLLLVIVLHLLVKRYLRGQARHGVTVSRSGAHTVEGQPPKTGLDPAVIASLPIVMLKQSDNTEDSCLSTICAVCLSFLEDQEMVRVLPNCKHGFHALCIDKWFSSRSTCPLCRMEVKPLTLPMTCEGVATGTVVSVTPVAVERQ